MGSLWLLDIRSLTGWHRLNSLCLKEPCKRNLYKHTKEVCFFLFNHCESFLLLLSDSRMLLLHLQTLPPPDSFDLLLACLFCPPSLDSLMLISPTRLEDCALDHSHYPLHFAKGDLPVWPESSITVATTSCAGQGARLSERAPCIFSTILGLGRDTNGAPRNRRKLARSNDIN